jgi:predicted PolB exonuclease-like 3'-5' exonuclease
LSEPILAFDIETIPDTALGSRLWGLEDLSEAEQMEAMLQKRRQDTGGSEFMPIHLHAVLVIGMVLRTDHELKCFSLGARLDSEHERIKRFFSGLDRHKPRLVSWNGNAFDLPVLQYRAFRYAIPAATYWETGDHLPEFRFNHYRSRYHWRHTDLMDVLGGYQSGRNAVRLDEAARLVGLPGKLDLSGSEVLASYLAGERDRIDRYCEVDALTTYLLFLRLERMRGRLAGDRFQAAIREVEAFLVAHPEPHWQEFLAQWDRRFWELPADPA